ncbi:GntR family transcriptional regulator [Thalassobacillus pellis]|uniref:GntR family transcriptional regulator n=1 Tax=Thalassobacillus pellis TaxID=748008 RepID=UPI001961E72C|nr:DNA-binding FadR family transcriptional regulator [Thalassobacillus pellis]
MTKPTTTKVYEEVLRQIRHYMETHRLRPGDKLPSERELSDLLNVGRSSIREAFRAMELLGLLETRRGEGTFLRSYRPYHMVDLLSTFILNETRTKEEIYAAKVMLETEAVTKVASFITSSQLDGLESIVESSKTSDVHYTFFQFLFDLLNNDLLRRMWELVDGFANAANNVLADKKFYHNIIAGMADKDYSYLARLCERNVD